MVTFKMYVSAVFIMFDSQMYYFTLGYSELPSAHFTCLDYSILNIIYALIMKVEIYRTLKFYPLIHLSFVFDEPFPLCISLTFFSCLICHLGRPTFGQGRVLQRQMQDPAPGEA